MPGIFFLDTASLIHAMQAGLGGRILTTPVPANPERFLELLLAGNERVVINSVIMREIVDGSHKDGGMLEDFVRRNIASGRIELHEISQQDFNTYYNMSDGGERSLIELTAKHADYYAPPSERYFVSDENFTQKQFYTDAGYTEANWRSNPGIFDERHQASGLDPDFRAGTDYVRSARAAGLTDNGSPSSFSFP
jgi:hypothetical protein